MDGAQAFSLTMCSRRVRLADATWQRMSYVPSAIRNARGQVRVRLRVRVRVRVRLGLG